MRYDDDNSQSFGPVLRRIAILAAIIIAVPVMLWSITSFMRTFVAQPVIPSAKPMAAADLTPTPAPVSSPMVEARATATDARGSDADGKGNALSNGAAVAPAPTANVAALTPADTTGSTAPTPAAAVAPQPNDQTASNPPNSANSPWPDPSQAIRGQPLQNTASADDSSDALPASPPLTGPVPLPPHRPKYMAMADGSIPLPRRRPTDADAAAAEPPADNGNLFTHLFGQTH
jgi:hypothetical protein